MKGDFHARFDEKLRAKFPQLTLRPTYTHKELEFLLKYAKQYPRSSEFTALKWTPWRPSLSQAEAVVLDLTKRSGNQHQKFLLRSSIRNQILGNHVKWSDHPNSYVGSANADEMDTIVLLMNEKGHSILQMSGLFDNHEVILDFKEEFFIREKLEKLCSEPLKVYAFTYGRFDNSAGKRSSDGSKNLDEPLLTEKFYHVLHANRRLQLENIFTSLFLPTAVNNPANQTTVFIDKPSVSENTDALAEEPEHVRNLIETLNSGQFGIGDVISLKNGKSLILNSYKIGEDSEIVMSTESPRANIWSNSFLPLDDIKFEIHFKTEATRSPFVEKHLLKSAFEPILRYLPGQYHFNSNPNDHQSVTLTGLQTHLTNRTISLSNQASFLDAETLPQNLLKALKIQTFRPVDLLQYFYSGDYFPDSVWQSHQGEVWKVKKAFLRTERARSLSFAISAAEKAARETLPKSLNALVQWVGELNLSDWRKLAIKQSLPPTVRPGESSIRSKLRTVVITITTWLPNLPEKLEAEFDLLLELEKD